MNNVSNVARMIELKSPKYCWYGRKAGFRRGRPSWLFKSDVQTITTYFGVVIICVISLTAIRK